MQQIYHFNAKTNINTREQIQHSLSFSNKELAIRFNTSTNTISKWRNREFVQDASCRPKNIEYALSELETALVISIRTSSWFPLDEVHEAILEQNALIARSSVYRCFVKNKINKVPQEQKDKAKKFKAYQPGYLHIDVTYLPNLMDKVHICLSQSTEQLEHFFIKFIKIKLLNLQVFFLINV